jgi:hypothetical protein
VAATAVIAAEQPQQQPQVVLQHPQQQVNSNSGSGKRSSDPSTLRPAHAKHVITNQHGARCTMLPPPLSAFLLPSPLPLSLLVAHPSGRLPSMGPGWAH